MLVTSPGQCKIIFRGGIKIYLCMDMCVCVCAPTWTKHEAMRHIRIQRLRPRGGERKEGET